MYGSSIRDMVSVNRYDALVSRPGRIQLEALPLDRAQLYDPRYTRGWLSERFSAFGYDDLKGARTFQYFYDGASTPNSPVHRQIHWLIAPSQLVIADNAPLNLVLDAAERCGPVAACDISGRSDGRVKPLRFFENGEVAGDSARPDDGRAERSVVRRLEVADLPCGQYVLGGTARAGFQRAEALATASR